MKFQIKTKIIISETNFNPTDNQISTILKSNRIYQTVILEHINFNEISNKSDFLFWNKFGENIKSLTIKWSENLNHIRLIEILSKLNNLEEIGLHSSISIFKKDYLKNHVPKCLNNLKILSLKFNNNEEIDDLYEISKVCKKLEHLTFKTWLFKPHLQPPSNKVCLNFLRDQLNTLHSLEITDEFAYHIFHDDFIKDQLELFPKLNLEKLNLNIDSNTHKNFINLLRNQKNLKKLILHYNFLNDNDILIICNEISNLKCLSLNGGDYTKNGLVFLQKLTQLQVRNLTGVKFSSYI